MDIRLLAQRAKYSETQIPLDLHFHDSYELLYVRDGMSKLSIGNREYILQRGSLAFISCQEDHSITILSSDYQRYYVLIFNDKLDIVTGNPRLSSVFRNRPNSFSHVFDMRDYADEIDSRFASIIYEFEHPQKYSDDLLCLYIREILIYSYRVNPNGFYIINDPIYSEIYRIQKYIENHYKSDIKISEIASDNFISIHYLSKCFKKQTGLSPKQYLTNTRLAHAKHLLTHTQLSVKDVAIQSGFTDVNNFIRTFRENTGITPHKYRTSI